MKGYITISPASLEIIKGGGTVTVGGVTLSQSNFNDYIVDVKFDPPAAPTLYMHNITIGDDTIEIHTTLPSLSSNPIVTGSTASQKLTSVLNYIGSGYFPAHTRYQGDELSIILYKSGTALFVGGVFGAPEKTIMLFTGDNFDMYGSVAETVSEA